MIITKVLLFYSTAAVYVSMEKLRNKIFLNSVVINYNLYKGLNHF